MLNAMDAFQDLGTVRYCFGCGADNGAGLQIKSYWDGDDAVCSWYPQPHHCGGRKEIVYGGILASIMECHSTNLAIAHAYRSEARAIGSAPRIFYVTGRLEVSYLLPTPMGEPLELRAKLNRVAGRKSWVSCGLSSAGQVRAQAEVLAIRVYRDETQGAER
jgi:hypothetical protein